MEELVTAEELSGYTEVKMAFDEAGITIPFPQRDVHLIPHNEA